MSKPKGVGPAPTREINEGFLDFLGNIAKGLTWLGAILTVAGMGFLIYTSFAFSKGATPSSPAQALVNIGILKNFLFGGILALAVGSSFLFWGESILGGLQLVGGVILFLSPMILSQIGIQPGQGGNDKD